MLLESTTFIVSTLDDESDGNYGDNDLSLREAISLAQNGDTITFANNLANQSIILRIGQLTIDKSITIDGDLNNDKTPDITIDGDNKFGILNINIADPASTKTVNLDGLIMTKGSLPSVVADTQGVVSNQNAQVRLSNSLIGENGTRYTYQTGLIAGIENANQGHFDIINTTISNFEGTPIVNEGVMNIFDSNIIDNNNFYQNFNFGGIYNEGTISITNSTVANNTSQFTTGGIHNLGQLDMVNSTVSGNITEFLSNGSPGIYNEGTVNLSHTTVVDNSVDWRTSIFGLIGNGIYNEGVLTTENCIVDNIVAYNNVNLEGVNFINGIKDGNDRIPVYPGLPFQYRSFFTGANIINGDPHLSPLQDNGGATLTHIPLQGSLVIDASNTSSTNIDQRGLNRPEGLSYDLGAVELHLTSQILNGTAQSNTLKGFDGNDQLDGRGGNDLLFGYGGNDSIKGSAGNDAIQGGVGSDVLIGGTGIDKFVYSSADLTIARQDSSVDLIRDFNGDKITLLDGIAVYSFSDQANAQIGDVVFINKNNNTSLYTRTSSEGSITEELDLFARVNNTNLTISDFELL